MSEQYIHNLIESIRNSSYQKQRIYYKILTSHYKWEIMYVQKLSPVCFIVDKKGSYLIYYYYKNYKMK